MTRQKRDVSATACAASSSAADVGTVIERAVDALVGNEPCVVAEAACTLSNLSDRRECEEWQRNAEYIIKLNGVDRLLNTLFANIAVLDVVLALQRLMWSPEARRTVTRSGRGNGVALLVRYMDCSEVMGLAHSASPLNLNQQPAVPTAHHSDIHRITGWMLAELATDQGAPVLAQGGLNALFTAVQQQNSSEAAAAAAWACALLSAQCDHALPMIQLDTARIILQIAIEENGVARQNAIFALANLAAQTWLHSALNDSADVIGTIIPLLKDPAAALDVATRRQCLRVLSNLALSAENAARILQIDSGTTLLQLLCASQPEIQRQALRLVVNLSSKRNLAPEVARRSDLRMLAVMLSSAQVEIQQDAVRALCNILDSTAAEQALDAQLLAHEVLPRLIKVIGSNASPDVQRIASLALSHVTCHHNKIATVGHGALKVLSDVHRTTRSEEVQEASGAAIDSLGRVLTPMSRRAYQSMLVDPRNPKAPRRASPLARCSLACDARGL